MWQKGLINSQIFDQLTNQLTYFCNSAPLRTPFLGALFITFSSIVLFDCFSTSSRGSIGDLVLSSLSWAVEWWERCSFNLHYFAQQPTSEDRGHTAKLPVCSLSPWMKIKREETDKTTCDLGGNSPRMYQRRREGLGRPWTGLSGRFDYNPIENKRQSQTLTGLALVVLSIRLVGLSFFKTWESEEGAGLPGSPSVIGPKLGQELMETKAVTEANSIRGMWWLTEAKKICCRRRRLRRLQKQLSCSSRETWSCQHSFISTADQPDHSRALYYTQLCVLLQQQQKNWVGFY